MSLYAYIIIVSFAFLVLLLSIILDCRTRNKTKVKRKILSDLPPPPRKKIIKNINIGDNNMITKEDCRQLYNYYSQVETTEKLIEDLEKFVQKQGEVIPDVIPESYSSYGSIQLCVPTFKQGQFQTGSATIFNISYNAALRVLRNHIEDLRNKIQAKHEELKNEVNNLNTFN